MTLSELVSQSENDDFSQIASWGGNAIENGDDLVDNQDDVLPVVDRGRDEVLAWSLGDRRMIRVLFGLMAFLVVTLSFSACSSEQPKLPPGRCYVSADCGEGQACRETWCKDIYFPREQIKPN